MAEVTQLVHGGVGLELVHLAAELSSWRCVIRPGSTDDGWGSLS